MRSSLNDQVHSTSHAALPEERREWVRIDDRLPIEYRLTTESPDAPAPASLRATQESIDALIDKPTADLLARSDDTLSGSPLVPWLRKIDWLLGVTLKTLAKMHPEGIQMAQVAEVNISGGGMEFNTEREFQTGQDLVVKLILPPFTPIEATAHIIRVTPLRKDREGFRIATHFTAIGADDQEFLIRHILLTQAERLRARRSATG